MGFWDAVGSVASKAMDVISSIGSKIESIVPGAKKLLDVGVTFIDKLHPIIKAIVIVAKILEVFNAEEDVDEIGAKAMKSDKNIDDFDSVDEYMQHLRNDIELTKEELENASDEKKLARKVIGASIALKGISQKKNMDVSADFMIKAVGKGLSGEDIYDMLDDFKNDKLTPQDFVDYVNNQISTSKEEKMDDLVEQTIKKSKSDLSPSEIEEEVLKFTRD